MFTGNEAHGRGGYMWKQVVHQPLCDMRVTVFMVYEGCEVYNTAVLVSEVKL